jgi:hypothetical protein
MKKFKIGEDVFYGKQPAVVGAIIDGGKQYRIHYCITGNERQCLTKDVAPKELTKLE